MADLQQIVMGRKSVRSFDGRNLTQEDREKLIEYAGNIDNPFDIAVEFKFLDAAEHGLSSPVLTGEKMLQLSKMSFWVLVKHIVAPFTAAVRLSKAAPL